MDILALPIKKRGRPKKILTDYEIEEATRAAMYTRPAIEITKVPRVYTAEGLALSREVALELIIKAVERVDGPDPIIFVAKKSAPVTDSAIVPITDTAQAPAPEPAQAPVPVPTLVPEEDNTPKVMMILSGMIVNNNVVIFSSNGSMRHFPQMTMRPTR